MSVDGRRTCNGEMRGEPAWLPAAEDRDHGTGPSGCSKGSKGSKGGRKSCIQTRDAAGIKLKNFDRLCQVPPSVVCLLPWTHILSKIRKNCLEADRFSRLNIAHTEHCVVRSTSVSFVKQETAENKYCIMLSLWCLDISSEQPRHMLDKGSKIAIYVDI